MLSVNGMFSNLILYQAIAKFDELVVFSGAFFLQYGSRRRVLGFKKIPEHRYDACWTAKASICAGVLESSSDVDAGRFGGANCK